MSGNALVQVRDVHKTFIRGDEQHRRPAGPDVSRSRQGEFLALMGPSGSGKSTLLNLIGGLDRPDLGLDRSSAGGERIDSLGDGKLAAWRARHVGFVFQMYNLLPVLTAERNVELPLLLTQLSRRRGASSVPDRALARRPRRPREALPAPALRRPGAARGHRARHRHRPDAAALRRAHRRSRPQVRATRSSTSSRRSTASTARRSIMVTHDPHAAAARHAHRSTSTRACWSRRRRHEIPAAPLEQPEAPQGAHDLHAPVDPRRLRAVRATWRRCRWPSAPASTSRARTACFTTHKTSIIQPLPKSYQDADRAACRASWR